MAGPYERLFCRPLDQSIAAHHPPRRKGPLLHQARLITEEKHHLFNRLLDHRTGYRSAI
ncbi:hypothetical protein [Kitasatospora sp. NPDC057223]|uniref:hypothetical protein n=1 Tax=Kitasatospora sp. NPDC057223 TaxID=3346055 RepID=UPI00363F8DCA